MLHKRSFILIIVCALFLSACGGATGTPAAVLNTDVEAWVEYPYEGSTLPMGPVQLVVYASSAEGMSYVHIKVNGQSLPASAVMPLTTDGSSRLARADVSWTPPGEGQYVVEAAGVSSGGITGGFGSTRFCIVTCNPNQTVTPAVSDSTETPTPAVIIETETVTPTSVVETITPAAPGETTVEFYSDPKTIQAGSCAMIRWTVTSSKTVSVYYSGDLVNAIGNHQTCPCQNETHSLQVTKADGSSLTYLATVNVTGSCGVEQPPPVIEISTTAPPPAPSDTSGPNVNSVNLYWAQEGCSLWGSANITDPSGVIWGEFWFNLNNQGWAWIKMNQSGNLWTSQVGIDTAGLPGSVEYKVRTEDSLNNEAWSGVFTKNFAYCGD